jgi:CheY-like chemotaxis protein
VLGKNGGPGPRILLVEDDAADARLFAETFKELGVQPHLEVAGTAQEATEHLTAVERSFHDPGPDVIFLDLNLPGKDGRKLLAELREHPKLHRIPLVILTASRVDLDLLRAFLLGVQDFIRKPITPEDLRSVFQRLQIPS